MKKRSFALIFLATTCHAKLDVIYKDGLAELDCVRPAHALVGDVSISCAIDGVHLVSQDSAHGKQEALMNQKGDVISAWYEDISFVGDGLIKAKKHHQYTLLTTTGKVLTPTAYDDMGLLSDNRIAVKMGENWGYIDKTGTVVIPPKYGLAFGFEDGLAMVYNHGSLSDDTLLVGLVNLEGKEVFPLSYRSLHVMGDKVVFGTKSRLDGVADRHGRTLIEPKYANIGGFSHGHAIMSLLPNDLYGYINDKGQEVISPQYFKAKEPHQLDGKLVFVVAKKAHNQSMWGVVDKNNRTLIDFNYSNLKPTQNVIIATNQDYHTLLLDSQGKALTPVYDDIVGFTEGVGEYVKNHKTGLIGIDGKTLTEAIYDGIRPEFDSTNKSLIGFLVTQNHKQGLISPQGQIWLEAVYDDIMNFQNGVFYLKQQGRYGIATLQGKILVAPTYEDIRPLSGGHTKAKQDGQWYLLDPTGICLGKSRAPTHP